jgi:hypothetical protein
MAARREGWTLEWFDDPRQADHLDRQAMAAMTPQQRLDLHVDMLRRWGKTDERGFERVLEIVEFPSR